jgi:YD repeat-containing protein
VVTLTYDAKGNVVSLRDPLNNTTSIGYNVAGQPSSVTPPGLAATTMEYAGGLPTAVVVNALGYRVSRAYDGLGRMVSVTDPMGATARIEYL